MGSKAPRPGIQDDKAENRLKDMDDEGVDAHFLIPTSWLSFVGVDDTSIEVAMIRAFHRHMADFCGSHPDRLTGPIVASTRRVDEAVQRNSSLGQSQMGGGRHAVARRGDCRRITRGLEPIWREAQEHDLPIANHSFHLDPAVLYPGYRDMYDNIFLGRLAAHPWGAMRFAASFIGGVVVRAVTRACAWACWNAVSAGCRSGLGAWTNRRSTSGGTAPLKMTPSEYMMSGRFFCSIEHHEGEDMWQHVTGMLGDDLLMYASGLSAFRVSVPSTRCRTFSRGRASPRPAAANCCGRMPIRFFPPDVAMVRHPTYAVCFCCSHPRFLGLSMVRAIVSGCFNLNRESPSHTSTLTD